MTRAHWFVNFECLGRIDETPEHKLSIQSEPIPSCYYEFAEETAEVAQMNNTGTQDKNADGSNESASSSPRTRPLLAQGGPYLR